MSEDMEPTLADEVEYMEEVLAEEEGELEEVTSNDPEPGSADVDIKQD